MKAYTFNSECLVKELQETYSTMRESYCGFPITDNQWVSRIIFDLKRGKAAYIYGLTAEHLQYSHPVICVII